jgi:hypothetical protein
MISPRVTTREPGGAYFAKSAHSLDACPIAGRTHENTTNKTNTARSHGGIYFPDAKFDRFVSVRRRPRRVAGERRPISKH